MAAKELLLVLTVGAAISAVGLAQTAVPVPKAQAAPSKAASPPPKPEEYGVIAVEVVPGQTMPIIVYVSPSPAHAHEFNSNMLQLEVTGGIYFSGAPGNQLLSIKGLSSTIKRSVGEDLKVTSPTETLTAKNGIVEIALADGHKLLLPIRGGASGNLQCSISNADFLLTRKPADPIGEFIDAARDGNVSSVQKMLAAKADVNAKATDGDSTALIMASLNGHANVVSLLLAAKADVNAKLNNGGTALLMASQTGHADVVKLLLAAKADVSIKTNKGDTALSVAAASVVELLKSAGALQ